MTKKQLYQLVQKELHYSDSKMYKLFPHLVDLVNEEDNSSTLYKIKYMCLKSISNPSKYLKSKFKTTNI